MYSISEGITGPALQSDHGTRGPAAILELVRTQQASDHVTGAPVRFIAGMVLGHPMTCVAQEVQIDACMSYA